ncbi:hypothetical protein BYT27DRAFT_7174661 [Phlegmacium glaucopus]|nr:hypothetical protein BYT27DRAFT_7174661 [Phlegmacium glaucopus]
MKSLRQFVAFVIALLTFSPVAVVGRTNFNNCITEVNKGIFGNGTDIGGTDNQGHAIDVFNATGVTYSLCIRACGGDQEPFSWTIFSQEFSSWLLPWLALVSQLPFGANDKLDNLDSVVLTVGSPTLAAYSLALTVLNGRWVAQRFAGYTYPNVRNAIRILSSLQQSPLQIETSDGLLASLVVLPQNDEWWSELIVWINYTHTWSISAVNNIAWVVIAYIFTLIDSFTAGVATFINSNGQAVGSLWLWLLPIVIGWLQISPKCDSTRLSSAVERANKIAYVATDDSGIVLVKYANTEARAINLTITEVDHLRRDEKCTSPIFNYARFLPWVQAVEKVSEAFEAASVRYHHHLSVDPSKKWVTVASGEPPHASNRMGNKTQVEGYCVPLDNWRRRSRWGSQVLSRMFIASALALMLQWGTAGAAIMDVWFTPTRGLGCRSAAYFLYAVLSTLVWVLLVTSSILTHLYTLTTPGPRARRHNGSIVYRWSRRAVRHFSIFFRCLGKVIAAFNSILVVLTCVFQFGNFFNRCYCNSSVFWLRDHAYNVITLSQDDITSLRSVWIGGVSLAAGTAVLFVLFVNVYIDPPLPGPEP